MLKFLFTQHVRKSSNDTKSEIRSVSKSSFSTDGCLTNTTFSNDDKMTAKNSQYPIFMTDPANSTHEFIPAGISSDPIEHPFYDPRIDTQKPSGSTILIK
ncbi:MAG: hypothetical protein K2X77_31780 [Candidatus Obscuribacterales bacterium]|nr:hypothetical protein [Candidatus Obscuribacterales bacterium]